MMWDLRQDRATEGGAPPPIATAPSHRSHQSHHSYGQPSPTLLMPTPQTGPELSQPRSTTPYNSVPFPTAGSYAGYPTSTGHVMPSPTTPIPPSAPMGYSRSRSNSFTPGVFPSVERHNSHSSQYPEHQRSRHNSYNGSTHDGVARSHSRSGHHSRGASRSRANSYTNLQAPLIGSYPSAPISVAHSSHSQRPVLHSRSFSGDAPYTSEGRYGEAWDMSNLARSIGAPTVKSRAGSDHGAVREPVGWDRDATPRGIGVQYHQSRDMGDTEAWRAEERERGVLLKKHHHHTHHHSHSTSHQQPAQHHSSGGGHHHSSSEDHRHASSGGHRPTSSGGHHYHPSGHTNGGTHGGGYGGGGYADDRRHDGRHVGYADESGMHRDFCYSNCTGRRKALCIGINYTGSKNELKGCVNDAKSVYQFLVKYQNYKSGDIVFLSDEARDPRQHPTRSNMINAMRWLVKGAKKHDALFFHYSGHGAQTKDKDGDEIDGYDEVIFPVDFKQAGIITDDDLHDTMVSNLQPGVRLTAVFDSCHSGSVLDLPFLYHSDGRQKRSDVTRRFRKLKATPADVVTWSGCKDNQTSADTYQGGQAVGAMSYAFIRTLKRNSNITYLQLLTELRRLLKQKYNQKPQLSASHKIDVNRKFLM